MKVTPTNPGQLRPSDRRYQYGLTLVYCDGLPRAGEQVGLAGRSGLMIGDEERLFPGGPLEDRQMASRHATMTWEKSRWVLIDRGGRYGTWVNGRRIQELTLTPGDVIRIGSTFIVFGAIAPRSRSLMLSSVGAAIAEVEARAAEAAPLDDPQLLLGEFGTGKELVAHELHRLAHRVGPFFTVDCAREPRDVLERTLFGAIGQEGVFVRALDGTVYLDGLDEADPELQRRLATALRTKEVTPCDGGEARPIRTRVVASANRAEGIGPDSERLVPELKACFGATSIRMPSLRERREDLGVLVRVLLAREGGRFDVAPELMAAMLASRWALNIRGLIDVLGVARKAQPNASRLELSEPVRVALEGQGYDYTPY